MRKPIALLTAFFVVLLAVALVVSTRAARSRVSLDFVGYKWSASNSSWNAEFRLVNATARTVKYPATSNLMAVAMICRQKVWGTWTDAQWDTSAAEAVIQYRSLKPGETVRCSIQIEPGGAIKRAGTLGDNPKPFARSGALHGLQLWWLSLMRKWKMNHTPIEQIWCTEILSLPKSAQSGPTK
jgi:hypothetical protein